jgi:hypothetical protein
VVFLDAVNKKSNELKQTRRIGYTRFSFADAGFSSLTTALHLS